MKHMNYHISLQSDKEKNSFNDQALIPMINIIFLMLVFFLVAGKFTQQPKDFNHIVADSATETSTKASKPSIELWIKDDGTILYNQATLVNIGEGDSKDIMINQFEGQLQEIISDTRQVLEAQAMIPGAQTNEASVKGSKDHIIPIRVNIDATLPVSRIESYLTLMSQQPSAQLQLGVIGSAR